jgi:hypothetical protein
MAVRICGICKLALREDDSYSLVRLRPGDKPDVEIGLYHACGECAKEHRKLIAEKRPPVRMVHVENPDGSVTQVAKPVDADQLSEYDLA